jgi:hypothetical protein
VIELETRVKARSLELYARPNAGASDGEVTEFEALPGESEAQQVERLKDLLRAQWQELIEVCGGELLGTIWWLDRRLVFLQVRWIDESITWNAEHWRTVGPFT